MKTKTIQTTSEVNDHASTHEPVPSNQGLDGKESGNNSDDQGEDTITYDKNFMEYKKFDFDIDETKQITVNGQKIGVIRGRAAAFSIDRGLDKIDPKAFDRTILEHKQRNNRPIRMKFQHRNSELIGGFPIDLVKVDHEGLVVEGHINLQVQRGAEAFSLAKQGVLTDLSIGFRIRDIDRISINGESIRVLKEIDLGEISIVDEPMNINATIDEVKTVVPFQNLPILTNADGDPDTTRAWNSTAALNRVRPFTGSDEAPTNRYRRAFLWFDSENEDTFGAYKLPIADVVNGKLTVIPRAIFAAAAAMSGARGGVNIPESNRAAVIANINRYYDKMGLESPLRKGFSGFFNSFEGIKDVSDYLKAIGLSNKDATTFITVIKRIARNESSTRNDVDSLDSLLGLLNQFKNDVKESYACQKKQVPQNTKK